MIIYVGCWPILAFLAGKLIPAIGSGDLSNVTNIIINCLIVFLIQKVAQFGQDIYISKPSLEISEVRTYLPESFRPINSFVSRLYESDTLVRQSYRFHWTR